MKPKPGIFKKFHHLLSEHPAVENIVRWARMRSRNRDLPPFDASVDLDSVRPAYRVTLKVSLYPWT